MANSFFRHSFLYFFAEAFNKGLVFLTLPIFTFLLTPTEFGVMSIFTTITAILIVIMSLSSHQSVIRTYHNNDVCFKLFLGTLLPFITVFTVFCLAGIYFFRLELSAFIKIDNQIIVLASLVAFFGVFLQLELSYLLASNRSKTYTKILIFRNTLIIILSIIFILSLEQEIYYGRFYSELLVGALLFLFSVASLLKIARLGFDFKVLTSSLSYSFPLVFSGLAGLILLSSDVLFINTFWGAEQAGLYAFAFSISMIVYVLISAINNAWLPFYYRAKNENQIESIEQVVILNVKIVLCFSFFVASCSEYVVFLMAPESYYEAYVLIPILITGFVFLFLSNLFVAELMFHKKTLSVAVIIFIAAVINAGLNYYLIPLYGYFVAAWTTLLSYVVLFILNFLYVTSLQKALFPLLAIIKLFLIFFVLLVIGNVVEITSLIVEVFFKLFLFGTLVFFYKLHTFNFKQLKQVMK